MLFLLIIRAGDVVRFFTDKNKIKSIIDMDLDISLLYMSKISNSTYYGYSGPMSRFSTS